MSRSSILFFGLFGSFAISCIVLVLAPEAQLGGLQPSYTEEEGKFSDIYPINNPSLEEGRVIYEQEGCMYCHTQQVRDPQNGTDEFRDWGTRRTVARDYVFEVNPMLGSSRLGPDLANVGSPDWRNEPKDDLYGRPQKRDAAWQYLHLYAPRSVVKGSNQPAYRDLFTERKISGKGSEEALKLEGPLAPLAGFEIVPNARAKALVRYLQSLDHSHPLKEAAGPSVAAATPAK